MELCLLNLLILIVLCIILTLVCPFRACYMWLTMNHMFIREIWGKFTSFIFWNFEIFQMFFKFFKFFWKISRYQKGELGKLIPNFSLKHLITSTKIPCMHDKKNIELNRKMRGKMRGLYFRVCPRSLA